MGDNMIALFLWWSTIIVFRKLRGPGVFGYAVHTVNTVNIVNCADGQLASSTEAGLHTRRTLNFSAFFSGEEST